MFKKILSLSLCLSLLGISMSPSFSAESSKSNLQSVSSNKEIKVNKNKKSSFKDYSEKYDTLSKKYEKFKKDCEKLKQFNEKNNKGSIFSFKRLSKLAIRSLISYGIYASIFEEAYSVLPMISGFVTGLIFELV